MIISRAVDAAFSFSEVSTQSLAYHLAAAALRVALILALFGAGWSIYRRLPGGERALFGGGEQSGETLLHIVLRTAPNEQGPPPRREIPVQLYSIDLAAAQREFFSERRAGVRPEDFIARRMGGRPPIAARLDETGQTTVAVPSGKWWIHATLPGAQDVSWRLPVNIKGRQQTIELTPENAYTRTKSF